MVGTPLGVRTGITLPRMENMYVFWFYFVELWLIITQVWADISKRIAQICKAKGFIESDEVESLTPEKVKEFAPTGHLEWGANSRGKSLRAGKLGWKPKHPSLLDSLDQEVDMAAKALGL